MKKSFGRRAIRFAFIMAVPSAVIWSCSSPPPYGGGGRDLGPQAMPMNNDSGVPDATDTGTDTGVDTGVDTGTGG